MDRFGRFSLAISEISRYWHKLATEELAKYGLKGPHATYLTEIIKYPDGITVPELCAACGKDKSDASRMISILEQKKLVKKQHVGSSHYRGKLQLTSEGRRVAEHLSKRAARAVNIAGKDLTKAERELFYKALDSITANLRRMCEDGIPE